MKTWHFLPLVLLLMFSSPAFSQSGNVGIGTTTPDPSAALDIHSTDKGLKMPCLTTAQRDAILNPATGLIIYNTTDSCFNYYTGIAWYKDCGRSLTADDIPALTTRGGGAGFDAGFGVSSDKAGNVYVTGSFEGAATFGTATLTSPGGTSMFIVKYNPAGKVLWAEQSAGATGVGITNDEAGNVIVTGQFSGTVTFGNTTLTSSAGSEDMFTVKYNAAGQGLWAIQGGGTGTDTGYGVALDGAGNVLVTGQFFGSATFDQTTLTASFGWSMFTAKYNATGDLLWARQGGGIGFDLDGGGGIATDASGNVYVTGRFSGTAAFGGNTLTSAGGADVFTVKYALDGAVLWARQGGGTLFDAGYGIAVDGAGNVLVTGFFTSNATFGGINLANPGNEEVFILKYDANGALLWARQGGGTGNHRGRSIAADGADNVLITGQFAGMAAFETTTLTSAGLTDVFTVKYDVAGAVLWTQQGGGAGNDFGYGITTNGQGKVWITGQFSGDAIFDGITLAGAGERDMFLVQYTPSGSRIFSSSNLSGTQDGDTDPRNERISSAILNGNLLEITDAGGTTSVDLSSLTPEENDPQVGENAANYLSKWNGEALVRSSSVKEDDNGNVGIGPEMPDPSAALDIQSTDKGLKMPCLTTDQRDAIVNPATGLIIYNTTDSCFNYYTGKAWYKDCGRSLTADQFPALALQGGKQGNASGVGMAVDGAGNLIVTGYFSGTATFGNITLKSSLSKDVFIVKYNRAGKVLWAKRGGGYGEDYGSGVAVDGAGNILVTGYFAKKATFDHIELTGTAINTMFVVKYKADGALLWAGQSNGTGSSKGLGIAADGAGNVFVTGEFSGMATFDLNTLTSAGSKDVFLTKYSGAGAVLWAEKGGGNGSDTGYGLATDASGNVFLTGSFSGSASFDGLPLSSTANSRDMFITKYNASGTAIWANKGGGSGMDTGYGVATDEAGDVFVTGSFLGSATFDNITLAGAGKSDLFVVKYNEDGTILWAKKNGGNNNDTGKNITTDGSGNVFVTGIFYGTANLGNVSLVSAGKSDIFVVKCDTNGEVLWAKKGGGTGDDDGRGVATDGAGNVFVTGFFTGKATFGDVELTSSGTTDMFLVQFAASGGQVIIPNNLTDSQDGDNDPNNEHISAAVLNGNLLEITDAGGMTAVDLSGLTPDETDPQVGANTANYLPKWNGSALVKSTSVYEDQDGNVSIGGGEPTEKLEVSGAIKIADASGPAPAAGTIRWNPATEDFEGFTGAEWKSLTKGSEKLWGNPAGGNSENEMKTASNVKDGDEFGYSVAISGNYAIIGAPRDDAKGTDAGAAYIFTRSGNDWVQQAKLIPSELKAGNQFGVSVSISGDYALIGVEKDDEKGEAAGAAYIFFRSGSAWTQQARLVPAELEKNDQFGISVSISGDYALVGAVFDSDKADYAGAAYVFVRSGATWTKQAKLLASDGAALDWFGISVSISGAYALIGAPQKNEARGAAYVFVRSGDTWTQQVKLKLDSGEKKDLFGSRVSISGAYALIGAPYDGNGLVKFGSATIFVRSGDTWTQQARLVVSGPSKDFLFGSSVSISENRAIIGADGADDNQGAAYIFVRSGNTWTQQVKLIASKRVSGTYFARSVAISGDYAVVGARDGITNDLATGAVYFYY